MTAWQPKLLMLISCWVVVSVSGCEKSDEMPVSHNRDLGSGDTILLPPPTPMLNARIADGSADLPMFRVPGEEPPVEDDILMMLEEYNDVIDGGVYEDIPDYYVESQQQGIKTLFEHVFIMEEMIRLIVGAIEEEAPDKVEVVEDLLYTAAGLDTLIIEVEDIIASSETEASAKLVTAQSASAAAGMPNKLLFKLVDDEWAMEMPGLSIRLMLLPALETVAMANFGSLLGKLLAGTMSVDQLIAALQAGPQTGGGSAEIPTTNEEAPAEGTAEEPPEQDEEPASDEGADEETDEEPAEEAQPRRPAGTPG